MNLDGMSAFPFIQRLIVGADTPKLSAISRCFRFFSRRRCLKSMSHNLVSGNFRVKKVFFSLHVQAVACAAE